MLILVNRLDVTENMQSAYIRQARESELKINPLLIAADSGNQAPTAQDRHGGSRQADENLPPSALQELAAGDEFDAERVIAIKQAIRNGAFRIDAAVVADKLIAGTRDLIAKKG